MFESAAFRQRVTPLTVAIAAVGTLAIVLWVMVAINLVQNRGGNGPASATVDDGHNSSAVEARDVPGSAARPWRIMAVGDSITQTYQGGYSWRYFLDAHLRTSNVDFDMVGPQQGPFALANVEPGFNMAISGYADPEGWDVDHASRGGRSLRFYANASLGRDAMSEDAPPSGQNAQVDFDAYQPDIAIVMLGTNDLLLGSGADLNERGYTQDDAADDLARIVGIAQSANPDARVLLVAPPPTLDEFDPNARVRAAILQGLIRSVALELDEEGQTVAFVDSGVGFDPSVHHIDHTHPNATGDWIIARNIAEVLAESFGIGDRNFAVPRAVVPANPGVVSE